MSLFGGVEYPLVRPLVEGLRAEMIVTQPPPAGINDHPMSFTQAVREALQGRAVERPAPPAALGVVGGGRLNLHAAAAPGGGDRRRREPLAGAGHVVAHGELAGVNRGEQGPQVEFAAEKPLESWVTSSVRPPVSVPSPGFRSVMVRLAPEPAMVNEPKLIDASLGLFRASCGTPSTRVLSASVVSGRPVAVTRTRPASVVGELPPESAGVKRTVMVQLAPPAREVPQVVDASS